MLSKQVLLTFLTLQANPMKSALPDSTANNLLKNDNQDDFSRFDIEYNFALFMNLVYRFHLPL